MSIIAAIVKAAAHLSEITEEELATWREQASQETGDDYLRLIRERQLASWTGSSTPITQQISNSEQDLDRLLAAAVPDLKKLLPRLFAIELKQGRIDRLKEKYASQRAKSLTASGGGMHHDYVELIKLFQRLGAGPSKVRHWQLDDLVIIVDLARWKAEDPRYERDDNPWVAIRAIYAQRTMEKVAKDKKAGAMSVPGAPPRDRPEEWGTKYWQFGGRSAVQQPVVPTTSHAAGVEDTADELAPPQSPARSDHGTGTMPTETAPVEVEERADHMLSRISAAASLAEGVARFQATGERWYRPEINRQAPHVEAQAPQQPTGNIVAPSEPVDDVRADQIAPTGPSAPEYTPRPRRKLDADQAREIAPRYVEMERSWFDSFWPKSVPSDERRKEILIPALDAEFGNFRNAEPFASWFCAVEAGEVSGYIKKRRDNEIANIVKMLMNGHPTVVGRAERFGLLRAEDGAAGSLQ